MRDLLIRVSFFFPLYTHPQKLNHLLRLLISIYADDDFDDFH